MFIFASWRSDLKAVCRLDWRELLEAGVSVREVKIQMRSEEG